MKYIVLSLMMIVLLNSCAVENTSEDDKSRLELTKDSAVLPEQSQAEYPINAVFITNTNGNSKGFYEKIGSFPSISTETISKKSKTIINNTSTSSFKDLHIRNNIKSNNFLSAPVSRSYSLKQKSLTSSDISNTFYAYNANNETVQITASLKYGSTDSKCLIYSENGALDGKYDSFDFSSMGQLFDETIFPKVSETFATPTDVDANGKIIILYYDMGAGSDNILGFFYSADLYSNQSLIDAGYVGENAIYSNEMEIFYLNIGWRKNSTDPELDSIPDHEEMKRTLAHEFQHMVNFGYRILQSDQAMYPMDTWMDEGLAESSEQVVLGTVGASRLSYFEQDNNTDAYIRNGLSLVTWENTVASYSLVYTFMQYLRIHSTSKEGIFKKIINHSSGNYLGLTEIMKEENSDFSDFSSIIKAYRIASVIRQSSGIFGFGEESDIYSFSIKEPTKSISSIVLGPGGSIVVPISNFDDVVYVTGSGRGDNIEYSSVNSGNVVSY